MQLFGKEIPHPADTRIVDPPKAPPLTKAERMDRAVLTTYAAYREHHPRKAAEPSAADRKHLRALLLACGPIDADHDADTVGRAVLLIEWVALSADEYARQLRKEAPWFDGKLIRRDDLESLSRHVDKRLDQAEEWDQRGRTDTTALTSKSKSADPRDFSAMYERYRNQPSAK